MLYHRERSDIQKSIFLFGEKQVAAFTSFKPNTTALSLFSKPPLVILASCVITMYKSRGKLAALAKSVWAATSQWQQLK